MKQVQTTSHIARTFLLRIEDARGLKATSIQFIKGFIFGSGALFRLESDKEQSKARLSPAPWYLIYNVMPHFHRSKAISDTVPIS